MNSAADPLSKWLDSQLSEVLGFPATMEITRYILSMETPAEQDQYLLEMLDPSNRQHRNLVQEFQDRREKLDSRKVKVEDNLGGGGGVRLYKKSKEPEEDFVVGKKKEASPVKDESKKDAPVKKTKFVSLYSKDGQCKDTILLSGRHTCECLATKHDLVNNCIQCGRIVCTQEGSGPCLFCGQLVVTKAEQEILNRGSRKSEQLLKKLMPGQQQLQQTESSLSQAERHKNILLEYDMNSEKRTQVIDDESDYFSVDSDRWLTQEQRAALKKRDDELRQKRHGSRLDRKITFDFAGRRVVEEDRGLSNYDPSKDEAVKKIMEGKGAKNGESVIEVQRKVLTDGDGVVNPFINVPRPMLVDSGDNRLSGKTYTKAVVDGIRQIRLQDPELQEMCDEGYALSMHQPYASLLVCGVKRDEGRTWYSSVRGRVWIHAAAKVPSEAEVEEVKSFYRSYYEDPNLRFPSVFPTGCLLGCVDVVDCLSQEEYRDVYPNGESGSPYVFVCSKPQELLVKFPMSGKHKFYKLDPKIHQVAKKSAKNGSM